MRGLEKLKFATVLSGKRNGGAGDLKKSFSRSECTVIY